MTNTNTIAIPKAGDIIVLYGFTSIHDAATRTNIYYGRVGWIADDCIWYSEITSVNDPDRPQVGHTIENWVRDHTLTADELAEASQRFAEVAKQQDRGVQLRDHGINGLTEYWAAKAAGTLPEGC